MTECTMANRQIQFQHGISIPEFLRSFSDEAQCAQAVKQARAADHVVLCHLPDQPSEDRVVLVGTQASTGGELPHGVADAPEDQPGDGLPGRNTSFERRRPAR